MVAGALHPGGRRAHPLRHRHASTGPGCSASAPRPAAPPATWPSWPAPWASRRSAASTRRRWRCPTARRWSSTAAAASCRSTPSPAELAQVEARIARAGRRSGAGGGGGGARAGAAPATATASRWSPTSARLEDAREAVAAGAEGVGLLRSEFLLRAGATPRPSEDEQAAAYLAVAEALGPDRPLIIRTLDVGGDKPLPYLPLPEGGEPLPRRARHPRQPGPPGDLPRPAPRHPARGARSATCASCSRWSRRWTSCGPPRPSWPRSSGRAPAPVQVGIMIEVPSAAVMAERAGPRGRLLLHRHQRPHPVHAGHGPRPPHAGASRPTASHPAVLRLIAMTVRGRARATASGSASAAASPRIRWPCRCWSGWAWTSSR